LKKHLSFGLTNIDVDGEEKGHSFKSHENLDADYRLRAECIAKHLNFFYTK